MPKAEVGSTKWQANQMKMKGLQRLRWFCTPCEKQCRDENAFKQHTMSPGHQRQMMLVGEDTKGHIQKYSNEFKHDFLQLLRTSHREKAVQVNHFYNEYIANKEHVHMNATQWNSLTEFAKYLGREGICRIEEREGKGLFISWVDNSPEALRRQDALRKKERQDKGDEEREQRLIGEQIAKAHMEAKVGSEDESEERRELQRADGEKIKLNFAPKGTTDQVAPSTTTDAPGGPPQPNAPASDSAGDGNVATSPAGDTNLGATASLTPANAPVKISFGGGTKPKNVFSAKNNPFAGKKVAVKEQPKKMSEAERIMKEELERKRLCEGNGGFGQGNKRQRMF